MPKEKPQNYRRVIAPDRNSERVWIQGRYWPLPAPVGSPAADAEFARLMAHVAAGTLLEAGRGLTLLEIIEAWKDSSRGPKGRAEHGRAELVIDLLAEQHLETFACDFSAADLLAWQGTVCALRRPDGESLYNVGTVRKIVGIVRKAYSWAAVGGKVSELLAQSLERVPGPAHGEVRRTTKRRAVRPEVLEAVLPFLQRPVADLLRLIAETGARPHEIYPLRPRDVILHGEIALPVSGAVIDLDSIGCWGYLPPNKVEWADKDRVILFDAAAQAILANYLERDTMATCFDPRESYAAAHARQKACRKPHGLGNRKRPSMGKNRRVGSQYGSRAVCKAIERAAAKAGVEKFSPYQIRHRSLQEIRRVHGLDAAQAAAGHSSSATTEQRYAPPSAASRFGSKPPLPAGEHRPSTASAPA